MEKEKKIERKKETNTWRLMYSQCFIFLFVKKWKTYGFRWFFFYTESKSEDHYRSCFNYRGLRAVFGTIMVKCSILYRVPKFVPIFFIQTMSHC